MKTMNRAFLIGYLGNDPELKQSEHGTSYTRLSVATNRTRLKDKGKDTEIRVQETEWHTVYVWGIQGERCAQWLQKGALVFVEGEVRHLETKSEESEWPTKRSVIHAEEVKFLNPKNATLDNPNRSGNYDAVAHR